MTRKPIEIVDHIKCSKDERQCKSWCNNNIREYLRTTGIICPASSSDTNGTDK